ncbi:hypothetical protein H9Q72_005040 [Fusarium xylarioides]|uniref:AAA+ ATPase domain-containing protein n=1 Tax=Fusarium xylarioides TaxID=221167 RepID=A0A9P7L7Z3_9HYPO|nr:hypothetical protein H9Q72_005040 [Fusarium xylarioides]
MKELDPALYTIAWIAPLEIEAQAALHMLDNRRNGRFPVNRGDDYIFSAGDINGHNIIIATLPAGQEYGTGSAAALASQIKKFFTNLWCGLLVGVAAGLPNLRETPPIDIRLGDVLVGLSEGDSAGLIAYDLGKETSEGFQLLRSGRVLANTEMVIRSAIGNIKIKAPGDTDVFLPFYDSVKDKEHSKGTFEDPGQEKDVFYDIGDDGVDSPVQRLYRPTDRRTRVWYGSIGSGDKLTKNTRRRNGIRDRYGVIGLEMEAAGTMNRIPVGVIRGVCDYADEHKNKEWQPYASAMAAAYAKAVIYELGPGQVVPSSSMTNEGKHALCGTIFCDLPPTTDRFFGRQSELLEMVACLEATTQRKGVVLCGISGSGKTQLAREYVAQRRENFSAILWIDASSEESIEESFSDCSSRICEHSPEYRVGRESTPPRQLVLEWLRTTPDKNWLTVIDNANGPIPNKRLLGPFMDMNHGSLCVISTNQVTTRAVRLKQVIVEHLDASASQSLLLWRAYENDTENEVDGKDAANRTAKLLGGFPLALELAGVLHQRGIIPLDEFATNFTKDYPELAQFEIDSGVWVWTRDGANKSLFSMLDSLYASISIKSRESALLVSFCSIYGPSAILISLVSNLELIEMGDLENQEPWKQLQALVQRRIKLNTAIDELSKIFLATKEQAKDHTLVSFSLHSSICQWKLATMEDRDVWIIQATYSLSKHILSLHDKGQVFRFYNLFNRCLDLLWQHVDARHIELHGKFAEAYFTICLCGADIYLVVGKSETARILFTTAIDYIRCSSLSDPDEKMLLQLLCGLAKSCENIGEFEMAEEALSSAISVSEDLNGYMNDQIVSLVSRVKALRHHMLADLDNRKRVLIASTGPKPAPNSRMRSLLEFENEETYHQPTEAIPTEDGQDSLGSSSSLTGKKVYPDLAWEFRLSPPILFFSWQDDGTDLSGLSDAFPKTIQGRVNIMTYEKVDITSIFVEIHGVRMSAWSLEGQRNGKELTREVVNTNKWKLKLCDTDISSGGRFGDNCTFTLDDENSEETSKQPESDGVPIPYQIPFLPGSYSYSFEKDLDISLSHAERFRSGDISWTVCVILKSYGHPHLLTKELPAIQIPHPSKTRNVATNQVFQQKHDGISFCVDLPYEIFPIGGKLPITVTLSPCQNGVRAEYVTYTILERVEWWTQDRKAATPVNRMRKEAAFSHESDQPSEKSSKGYLPNLDSDEPVSISDDLRLPTCKQMKAGSLVIVGGSHPDLSQSETRMLETIEEFPIKIIDCRITQRSDLFADRMARVSSSIDNGTTDCGCPDADIFMDCSAWEIDVSLLKKTSIYAREVNGSSNDEVHQRDAILEEIWNQPIQGPSKSQHWEAERKPPSDPSTSEGSFVMEVGTGVSISKNSESAIDPRGEPPPYSD